MAQATKKRFGDWPGWDYVPGIAFIVMGVLALIVAPAASFATGIYLGAILTVAGVFAVAGGVAHLRQRGAWLATLLGLLSLAVGVAMLYNPVAGAISLTWLIGAWFVVGGIFEFATGFSVPAGRGWLFPVGLVDLAIGGFVLSMNPASAFLFLGYFVGVSFLMRGLWTVIFVGEAHEIGHAVREAVA